jgi:hypothetical protein
VSDPIPRSEWGADDVTFTSIDQPVPDSVAHHTASSVYGGASASRATEEAYMRGVEAFHQSLGWLTSAYHTVAFPSGRRYISRPSWAKGGATKGYNDTTLACCAVGNYELEQPTQALLDAMGLTFREWEADGNLAPGTHPRWGHRDVSDAGTACPGKHLYEEMDYLRSKEEDDMTEGEVEEIVSRLMGIAVNSIKSRSQFDVGVDDHERNRGRDYRAEDADNYDDWVRGWDFAEAAKGAGGVLAPGTKLEVVEG